MKAVQEKRIFLAYEFSLLIKAVQAFLEIVAGLLFYVINTNTITSFVLRIAHQELVEAPRDILSNLLASGIDQFSALNKFFVVFYLLSHGIIKLIIIAGLFLKKKWAFPTAILGFGGLIIYQIYHLYLSYSPAFLIFTLIDIVILWLVIREHKVPKRYTTNLF